VRTVHRLVAELDAVRVELGVPVEDVADTVGVAPEEVCWWAAGLRLPSLGEVVGYTAALGYTVGFTGPEAPAGPAGAEPAGVAWLLEVLEGRRAEIGMSRRGLARAVGVSYNTANRWSVGHPPSLSNFVGYADAVGWAVTLTRRTPPPARPTAPPPASADGGASAQRVRRPPHRLVVLLEAIRIELGWPRSEIPRRSSHALTKTSLQRWASGFVTPSLNDLITYARTLHCDLDVVRRGSEEAAPEVRRRRDVLREIEVERGTREAQIGGGPFHADGTGPQWGPVAEEAARQEVEAGRRDRLTWAVRAQAVFGRVLRRDNPEELRAEIVKAAALLVAWLEDLDAQKRQREEDQGVGDG